MEARVHDQKTYTSDNGNNIKTNNRSKLTLPDKKFKVRESLLTVLNENPHLKVIKHIFIASLIGLFFNMAVYDYFKRGEIKIGIGVISAGLGKIHLVAVCWIVLNIFSILCYYCFNLWANVRIGFLPKAKLIKAWDTLWLLSVPTYYIFQFQITSWTVVYLELPIASTAILCTEQTRMLMKIHAFIRSNVPKVTSFKPHSDKPLGIAKVAHYIYFMFAPTLIYRDEYPKTQTIRWSFVLGRLLELVGVIFYYAFLLEKFVIPAHQDIGLRPYSFLEVFLLMCDHGIVGLTFLLVAFYVVLHTTQNLFAELMYFGDREFYRDWWTSTNYSDYYRTWNIVVSDWLYTYIYKDCYEVIVPGNKIVAKIMVFLVSAIVHEWVLTYMFGFFFPALFISFFFSGVCLSSVKTPNINVFNILFWYWLALGSGWLVSLYATEYYVRANVPITNSTLKDSLVPRLFTCNCIV